MDPKLLTRYRSADGAAAYRRKYERSWTRKLSNRRELGIVRKALRRAGATGRVLDCPCGAGRLAPTLLETAEHVTCADISDAMVAEARAALAPLTEAGRVDFLVAPADRLPVEDGAYDTAVCHRLIHHMPEREERAAVFRELARVARRAVVLSFSDDTCWKARSQRRRGVDRRRHALTPDALREETAAAGLRMRGDPLRLNGFCSLVAVAVFDVAGAPA